MVKSVNVLGVRYKVNTRRLKSVGGYCDYKNKTIVLNKKNHLPENVFRHEVIHAFMFESGLNNNSKWAHNEEMVDFFAMQFPKMFNIFKKSKCLSK